mmetsp:Transcript_36504/g.65729  ORF Transcript_36504/g.65729 Transcript_36504/m.65729 type:complete len:113 (+) Transcript_36504:260-598(+)|eukprot:CAMPEP_0201865496 /NCGR_PEP_ID=MMETSP0902-20130614/356_1 /ASSEMBLY_ACC=CAM_ASM_000551 /TAXON_ID=420261 /ORGANISM="Thalassiosira antarctica, Strain CCMP982" /LENGTH=112 /DNA_ID=CAMNT_0048390255 /DNA_START=240 /DNA_END=578 /DNA_ORIENTATION=+
MKNPVNRLATAAPRALDSLLGGNKSTAQDSNEKKQRERTCSFDLDLSGLTLDSCSSSIAASVDLSGGSIAEEGSVVTFEELSEMALSSLDWNMDGSGSGMPSSGTGGTPSPN